MAAAAAALANVGHGSAGLDITAVQRGEQGNLIRVIGRADPAGTTGASTLAESGNTITVNCKNTTGTITETLAGLITAFATGRLVTAALSSGATGTNTGVAFTGALSGGASGAYGYDDLAAAQADGWALTNKVNASYGDVDVLEKVDRRKGGVVRVAAKAATGATNVLRPAYNEENRRAAMGFPRSLMGASGAAQYRYQDQS